MVLGVSGVANAITYTDMVTGPIYLNYKGLHTYAFDHIITDPDNGFVPGSYSLNATVKMTFDDDHMSDEREFIQVSIGGTTYKPREVNLMDVFSFAVDDTGLTDLQANGQLTITLQTTKGDLNFISSELVAHAPEPSTLILLGSGLAGVASLGFKRRKR
jgi:hypothetical protein